MYSARRQYTRCSLRSPDLVNAGGDGLELGLGNVGLPNGHGIVVDVDQNNTCSLVSSVSSFSRGIPCLTQGNTLTPSDSYASGEGLKAGGMYGTIASSGLYRRGSRVAAVTI